MYIYIYIVEREGERERERDWAAKSSGGAQRPASAKMSLIMTPPSNPPPTINLDGGDDYPPHKRQPNEGHVLKGDII